MIYTRHSLGDFHLINDDAPIATLAIVAVHLIFAVIAWRFGLE